MTVVAVESQSGGRLAGRVARPATGIDEQEIGPAVVVVVEKGHAAAHRFGQELLWGRPAHMAEVDTGLASDVGKAHRWRKGLGRAARPEPETDAQGRRQGQACRAESPG